MPGGSVIRNGTAAMTSTKLGPAIAVAVNGGRRTKADHPQLPMTGPEIVRAATECAEAGAAMLHIHVRGNDGRHVLDADAYRAVLRDLRTACGNKLLVQITTESLGYYEPDEQMAVVRAVRPEAASLALRELAPITAHEKSFADFLLFMKRENILPQIILYSHGDAQRLDEMSRRGLVPFERLPVLYVLGRYTAGMVSSPSDLLPFLTFESNWPWMICAFGPTETKCALTAALLGGDVRVGFENNIFLPNGQMARSNADLVAAVVSPLRSLNISITNSDGLRQFWAGKKS